jgi:predicted Zn finger-like uncharacterized protein
MNIRCPQCQTVFRVNPERIPPSGIRARCARCGGTFTVQPPSAQAPAATVAPPVPPPAPSAPAPASAPSPPPPAAAAPELHVSASTATAARRAPEAKPAFGARDPSARAERLARALVSDIVAYNPERRDKSLETGNLRTEFREEIMKSWGEYVAQVGLELAKATPYFKDALNNILAKGQNIF